MDSENPYLTFAMWLRALRRQRDLTQAQLGERAACSEATIRKIEAGERKPSRQLAGLLARALNLSAADTRRFLQSARGVSVEALPPASAERLSSNHNLPALLTSTVDRVRDDAAVTALLKGENVHLVTLIGPPGIGKTRLSIHCGLELVGFFPDGVWFCDLAEVHHPAFFVPAVARSLPASHLPPSAGLSQLINRLRDQHLLLILDNFEQIVDLAAEDVAKILKSCPRVKVLVTSRVPLRIYGENEYRLLPLSIPPVGAKKTLDEMMRYESVQLFVDRVRLHQSNFAITPENTDAVTRITAALEGIPLAVELAAASLRQLTLAEMVSLLCERNWIKAIGTPARDLPQRQRTLENVIEWSYLLLNDAQKDFYCRLGVFSGWFDVDAAAACSGRDRAAALSLLHVLSDHSLLITEPIFGKTCWRMLEIIHAHAYAKLPSPADVERLRAQYFLNKISEIKQQASWMAQEEYFKFNILNCHGAITWAIAAGDAGLGFRLAAQLEDFWFSLGYIREGLDICQRLFRISEALEPADRVSLMEMISDLAWQLHDFDTALLFAGQAVELVETVGLGNIYPWSLNRLGRIYIERGQRAQAKDLLQKAYDIARRDPSLLNPGITLAQLGEIHLFDGQLDDARSLLEQSLPHLIKGDEIFQAIARTDLAEVEMAGGRYDMALQHLAGALEPAKTHIRRLIVFFAAVAGYLVLSPAASASSAAKFYGAIEALTEQSGVILGTFYREMNQRRMDIARQSISTNEWRAAYEAGRQWDKEEAVRQAITVLNG